MLADNLDVTENIEIVKNCFLPLEILRVSKVKI